MTNSMNFAILIFTSYLNIERDHPTNKSWMGIFSMSRGLETESSMASTRNYESRGQSAEMGAQGAGLQIGYTGDLLTSEKKHSF